MSNLAEDTNWLLTEAVLVGLELTAKLNLEDPEVMELFVRLNKVATVLLAPKEKVWEAKPLVSGWEANKPLEFGTFTKVSSGLPFGSHEDF